MHKPHHAALPKIYENFFEIFLMFILTISDSLTTNIILYKKSTQILEKMYFSQRGCAREQ